MDNKRLYIDFHIIQTVPPSCVNRDDAGRPKTAIYGGTNRARVSSQAWKHSMRIMFRDIFNCEELGARTKNTVKFISDAIKRESPSIDDETAMSYALKALELAEIKIKDGKNAALFFISTKQAEALAKLVISGDKDKQHYKEAIKSNPSIDIALFGRMNADDPKLNIDACAQVAHSISTHSVQNEYDYFTAVDDISDEDNAGAGHIGIMEFNSATLYRYATINVNDLYEKIGTSTADAVRGFAEAFIYSMPTGKQNSFANKTMPDAVYVTIRDDQPVNMSGAFEKAVICDGGHVENSEKALFHYAHKVYNDFCGEPEKSYIVGCDADDVDAEVLNVNSLLDELYQFVKKNEVV